MDTITMKDISPLPQVTLGQAIDPDLAARLEEVYGDEHVVQSVRYQEALEMFRDRFGPGGATLFRAPGRINLIGGHTDYNHGYVLPVALSRDLLLIARPRSDAIVRLKNFEDSFPDGEFVISNAIPKSQSLAWTNYIRGAATVLAERAPGAVKGMDCLVVGAEPYGIPRGSGLSSSTALTVAATMALAYFAALDLTRETLIKLASDAEWYVGTRGGIMDQYASLFAQRNHALFLDCRPHDDGTYATRVVPLPEDYDIIVAESGVRHDNVRGGYNRRVAACRSGVGFLHEKWPEATHIRDLESVDWEEIEPLLPEELTVGDALDAGFDVGDIPGLCAQDTLQVRACCRHVWQENRRVIEAFDALSHGDVARAGKLISTAHTSARDNYDISFMEMETLVAAASTVEGVMGGRITGAGWGGCGVFLAQRSATHALRSTLERIFEERHGRKPAIFLCQSGSAAGHLATVMV